MINVLFSEQQIADDCQRRGASVTKVCGKNQTRRADCLEAARQLALAIAASSKTLLPLKSARGGWGEVCEFLRSIKKKFDQ